MSDPIPPDVITETSLNRQLPEIGREQIIKALDLAVLKPDARLEDVTNAARVVEDMGLASLCVASYNVAVAKQITSRVCSVIGFPHGNMSPQTKYLEAAAAIEDGATELDVVMNYGRFLEGRDTVVVQELGASSSWRTRRRCSLRRSSKRATTSQARSSKPAACAWTAVWTS